MTIETYDILSSDKNLQEEVVKLLSEKLPKTPIDTMRYYTVLRLTTIDGNPVSVCLAGLRGNNAYEIVYHNWDGYSLETATNPVHHHVSFVFADAKDYLDHLGGSKFIFTSNRDEAFVLARFPNARKTEGRFYEVTVE